MRAPIRKADRTKSQDEIGLLMQLILFSLSRLSSTVCPGRRPILYCLKTDKVFFSSVLR